jgi:hypothetical protein
MQQRRARLKMSLAQFVRWRAACVMLAGNGGCFPMHFDSDELLDGRRVSKACGVEAVRVTAVRQHTSEAHNLDRPQFGQKSE